MPRRPQRPCSYPGCPNRCDGQYCEEHFKQMNRRYNKFVRPADSNKALCNGSPTVRDVSERGSAHSC